MKKYLLSIVIVGLLLTPALVMGQTWEEPSVDIELQGLMEGLMNALWTIFAGVAVMAFVYAGILFLTASGDPEKLGQAKQAAVFGIAGIVVAIMGYSITSLVLGWFD